ncbi:hypothetical protein BN2476_2040008 [Paraburkholderia piptadeniae]|uniref:Uncharacterized protein n=1 Tax=Paraburkholderia piptadeniae TaxID=1701573 RepID=A0A1N7SXC2_9BURK|nr:hypothetical protein BN2476_2040008 [Paraburkholderia piptadeniae]
MTYIFSRPLDLKIIKILNPAQTFIHKVLDMPRL